MADETDSASAERGRHLETGGERPTPSSMWPQVFACTVAAVGNFLMGTSIAWSGPALALLQKDKNFVVTKTYASLVASLMPLGALTGGPLSGWIVSRLGRKTTMMINAALFALSFALLASAQYMWVILVGRFLTGMSSSLVSIVTPIYIAETSSPHLRGMLGATFQFMVCFGIFFVDVIGLAGSWRWLSVAIITVCLSWIVMLLIIPETPIFLISMERDEDARQSLKFLRNREEVEDELSEIRSSFSQSQEVSSTFGELFRKGYYIRPLVISLMLMIGQQLSGVNAVIFFSVKIFDDAGTRHDSFVENVIVATLQIVGVAVAMTIIDRLGRRSLLFFSSILMALSQVGLGTYFWIKDHNPGTEENLDFLPVTCLGIFIFAFSVGYGPIPWLMVGELFSPEMKSKAGAVSASFNWFLAFLVTQFYVPVSSQVGIATTFWGFAATLVVVLILSAFLVPETKGRSLHEIQALFRSSDSADNPSDDAVPLNIEDDTDRI